ncbi:LANO_0B06502g1_1 [Lachancea nothofagi CBS 11611]|uniref:LANO_0B06502g1_1 n=1 Tax=Lachancea nothofagi CBS 11611 TaxID=1266666 RepID=A0A1G4IZ91_9SACH|nr:LANO_0B06502g1_1 [Lachancea nothofagi CBS 11611]
MIHLICLYCRVSACVAILEEKWVAGNSIFVLVVDLGVNMDSFLIIQCQSIFQVAFIETASYIPSSELHPARDNDGYRPLPTDKGSTLKFKRYSPHAGIPQQDHAEDNLRNSETAPAELPSKLSASGCTNSGVCFAVASLLRPYGCYFGQFSIVVWQKRTICG